MRPIDKRTRERSILDLVYFGEGFEVEHSDSPDFVLTDEHRHFGVEVTDLYRDESDARLKLVPGYMGALLGGGRPLHKDDIGNLNVVTMQVIGPEGTPKNQVTGILRSPPTLHEHYEQLAAVIERKNEAHAHYASDLTHTNLLIADSYDAQVHGPGEISVAEILSPRVREALRTTPFRSVILISRAGYEGAVWRPLDVLGLSQDFFMFMQTVYLHDDAIDQLEPEDCVPMFVGILQTLGVPAVVRKEGAHLMASLGGFSVRYEDGILIHDYADYGLPEEVPTPSLRGAVAPETRETVTEGFLKMRDEGSLIFDYAMPAKEGGSGVFEPMQTVSLTKVDSDDPAND